MTPLKNRIYLETRLYGKANGITSIIALELLQSNSTFKLISKLSYALSSDEIMYCLSLVSFFLSSPFPPLSQKFYMPTMTLSDTYTHTIPHTYIHTNKNIYMTPSHTLTSLYFYLIFC